MEKNIKLLSKCADYAKVFLTEEVVKLLDHRHDNHMIILKKRKMLSYGSIQNLKALKLEVLGAYIEINLKNRFIQTSTSPADAFIFFIKKSSGGFQLCSDYHPLNQITIKN